IDPTPAISTDTDTPTPSSDLTVSKTDGTATYTPGTTTTYTIVVGNAGPSAANGGLVSDNIPAQLMSWTWVCSGATGGATGCDPAALNPSNFTDTVNLPVGSTITYTVTANISASATGPLVQTVTVTPPLGTIDNTPATSTDIDQPTPQSDLTVTKTDGTATYTPGTTTTYTIVVGNSGPSVANGAQVSDAIPAQLTSWTWVCSGATG